MAARRAHQLAALRPAGRDRSGHRLGQDRRGDRGRVRRAAPGPVRARGRSVPGAHGAVARTVDGGPARGADRAAGRQREGRTGIVRRARRDSPFRGGVQADAARHRWRVAHRRRMSRPRRPDSAPRAASGVRGTARAHRDAGTQRRRGHRAAAPVLRRHLLPVRLRAGDRRRRVRASAGRVRRGGALGRRTSRVRRDRATTRERTSTSAGACRTCRSSPSATSSPRSRTSPSATRAPTAARLATTSTRSRSGARSWRRRSASTSCSAVSAPAIKDADGALVFTETVRAANHAINRLDPLVSIDLITGSTARRQRREILDDLRVRRLDAVAAPRVLDEGIDVPDANLGVVMSASRTRRQMIQRMGRILRRKRAGVAAAVRDHVRQGHVGRPRQPHRTRRVPRRDRTHLRSDRGVRQRAIRGARRLSRRARPVDDSRTRASRELRTRRGRGRRETRQCTRRRDSRRARCRDRLRDAGLRAHKSSSASGASRRSTGSARGFRRATGSTPYLEPELAELPHIAKPKVAPKRHVDRTDGARDRARSATRGASAAPVAAKHHRSCSSGGRSSTRPSPAAAIECPPEYGR